MSDLNVLTRGIGLVGGLVTTTGGVTPSVNSHHPTTLYAITRQQITVSVPAIEPLVEVFVPITNGAWKQSVLHTGDDVSATILDNVTTLGIILSRCFIDDTGSIQVVFANMSDTILSTPVNLVVQFTHLDFTGSPA